MHTPTHLNRNQPGATILEIMRDGTDEPSAVKVVGDLRRKSWLTTLVVDMPIFSPHEKTQRECEEDSRRGISEP